MDKDPRIRLFGPMTLVSGGRTAIPLGGPRQRALLTALALHPGRPVPVPDLVAALWGDAPPPSAANALQVHVSGLRKLLAPLDLNILREGATYAVDCTIRDVDAALFEALVANAQSLLRAGDPGQARLVFERALRLAHTPLLAGLEVSPWLERARRAVDERRWSARSDLVIALYESGDAQRAVEVAQALVAEDPLDEASWARLMISLYHEGRPHAALEAYRTARRTLHDELGVEPSPQLVALHQDILTHQLPLPGTRHAHSHAGAEGASLPVRSPWLDSSQLFQGGQPLEEALSAATGAPGRDPRAVVEGWCSLGSLYLAASADHDAVLRCAAHARTAAGEDESLQVVAMTFSAHAINALGDTDRAVELGLGSVAILRRIGRRRDLAVALSWLVQPLLMLDRIPRARECIDEALELAAHHPLGSVAGVISADAALVELAEDKPAGSIGLATAVLFQLGEAGHTRHSRIDALRCLALGHQRLGNVAFAAQFLGAADALLTALGRDADANWAPALVPTRDSLRAAPAYAENHALGASDPQGVIQRWLARVVES